MIFVTGDTHGHIDIKKLEPENFPKQKKLTRNDYLIIAGDFGAVWYGDERDDVLLDYHNSKNYTTLFIAGNHENHNLLDACKEEDWHGGKIHRIRDNVLHLENGYVFDIDGKSIFTMGGATSVDKYLRTKDISWWEQEEPTYRTYAVACENLLKHKNKVDFIISHTCPESIRKNHMLKFDGYIDYNSGVERYLDTVLQNVKYKKWYFGHMHTDREITDFSMRILYNDIVRI